MEELLKRKKQLNIVVFIYLGIFVVGMLFSFLATYFIENCTSNQAFKIFVLPLLVLFIANYFLLIIFFMTYSKASLPEIPKWWFLFYVSMFIPYINYFVPLALCLFFLIKEASNKEKLFIIIVNFIPLITSRFFRYLVYHILINEITDKILLMDLNLFLNELVNWVIILLLVGKLLSIKEKPIKEYP